MLEPRRIAAIAVTLLAASAVAVSSAPAQQGAAAVRAKSSPTIGAQPTINDDNTLTLFDGREWSAAWKQRDGEPSRWIIQNDGSALVNGGDAVTTESFGDFHLHIEFRIPKVEGDGQARGNSGVYLHGRYEIQVLGSHGAEPANNECGGIYGIEAPLANASLPAEQWQTYDIVFRAPRFTEDGKVSELPRVTVLHNGVVIHNNYKIPKATPGGLDEQMKSTGPLLLQDHGDAVRYRNIWLRRL